MIKKITTGDAENLGDAMFKKDATKYLSQEHIRLFTGKWMSSVGPYVDNVTSHKNLSEKQIEEIEKRGLTDLVNPGKRRAKGEKRFHPIWCYEIEVGYKKKDGEPDEIGIYNDGTEFRSLSIFTLLVFREDGFSIENWNKQNIDFLYNHYKNS